MKRRQLFLILQTVLALVIAEVLVLWAVGAAQNIRVPALAIPVISARQFLLTFLVASAFFLFLIKRLRNRIVFKIIFALSLLAGVWFLTALIVPGYAFVAAVLVVGIRYLAPYVISQNVLMVLGIAGISSAFGSGLTWQTMLIILLFLAIYDVIAVYGTKHMVTMFKGLVEKGVIFALIIPERPRLLFKRLGDVGSKTGFFFLGSGDLALPCLFVACAVRYNYGLALGAMVGSVIGLIGSNYLFKLGRGRPMPALPPIAIGTLLGFFVVMLIQYV